MKEGDGAKSAEFRSKEGDGASSAEGGRSRTELNSGAEGEAEVVDRRTYVGCGCEIVVVEAEVVVAKAEVVWGGETSPVEDRLVGEEIAPRPVGRCSWL